MDFSKAVDCIRHNILTTKLHANGFSHYALMLVYSYLANQQHNFKVNGTFSNYKHIKLGVPHGTVLGPLLFNIYDNDQSIHQEEICKYVDDTTI